jgi:hypothetical protein
MVLVYLIMGRFLVPAWGSVRSPPPPFSLHTRYTWALTFQNICKNQKQVEFLRFIFFSNFFTGIIIFFTQVYCVCVRVCVCV